MIPGNLNATYKVSRACYALTLNPGQIAQALFGNTIQKAASVRSANTEDGLIITDLPDLEVDEANYDTPYTDELYLEAPDSGAMIYLPLITK